MIDSSVLEQYSLFDGLEQEQIDRILSHMTNEAYNADEEIIIEGSQNCKICFIQEGQVAAIKNGVVLEKFNEGAFFGEMEVLDISPSAATVKALCDTKLMVLSIDALAEIYETDLKTYSFIIMNLARDLSRKIRRMNVIVTQESLLMDWS